MVPSSSSTCWTLIRGAAAGDESLREQFFRRYEGMIEAYLRARWRGGPPLDDLPDARQEVFLECLKGGGALERADAERSFRGYLHGVVQNVARRFEHQRQRAGRPLTSSIEEGEAASCLPADRAFERAWAAAVLMEARVAMERRAEVLGTAARRRTNLLHLRFSEGLSLRELARRWDLPEHRVHKDYAKAREEFRLALREAVTFYIPNEPESLESECRAVLDLMGSGE